MARRPPPPFYVKVRNITRHIKGVEFSSKTIGVIVAKEHAVFFKTLLTRACDENIFPGMGHYYNVLRNDRTFPQIIKWHNDQIANTVTIPVLGISREAMLQPINVKRGTQDDKTTTLRKEISQSGLFSAIHSTKQTYDKGRWILVLSNKNHTEAAVKFFNTTINAIYSTEESQINRNDLVITTPLPKIEPREESYARSNNPTRNLQANAWASIMDDTQNVDEGSKMPNKSRAKQRKRVEISFDPESKEQFPELQNKSTDKQNPRPTRKGKQKNDQSSPTSSQSDSIISAVTRAEFTNFSQNISQMVKDEVQSTISNSTDQTMLTIYRDELAANRRDTQAQMKILQQQMAHFHTLPTNLAPQTNTPTNNNSTPTHSNQQTTSDYEFHTPTNTQADLSTQEDPPANSNKRVEIADQDMPASISHNAPSLTEFIPNPKRTRAMTPTSQNKTKLISLQTSTRASGRQASKVPIPSNSPSTTTGKKQPGGGRL
jgi:hypothetical protein